MADPVLQDITELTEEDIKKLQGKTNDSNGSPKGQVSKEHESDESKDGSKEPSGLKEPSASKDSSKEQSSKESGSKESGSKESGSKESADTKAKSKWRERIAPPKEIKEEKKQEPKSPEIEALEKRLAEYENDKAIQAIVTARKNNKNIFDVLDEVRGSDYKRMSDEEKYVYKLKQLGIKSNEDSGYIEGSPSIESELDKFRDMPVVAQRKEISEIDKELKSSTDEKVSSFLGKLSEPTDESKLVSTYNTEIQDIARNAINKEIFGVQATNERMKKVMESISKGLVPLRPDNTIDTDRIFLSAFLYENYEDIFDSIESNAFSEGAHEIADQTEAKPGSAFNNRVPDIQPKFKRGSEEEAKYISENLVPLQ